jgi:hypothetical protein
VIQSSDGSYVAVGWSGSTVSSATSYDNLIAKFSATGELKWEKIHTDSSGKTRDYFHSVTQASDGGYLAVGASEHSPDSPLPVTSTSLNLSIVKFDDSGVRQWSRYYGGSSDDTFNSVIPAKDGGYVAAGMAFSSDVDFDQTPGTLLLAKFTEPNLEKDPPTNTDPPGSANPSTSTKISDTKAFTINIPNIAFTGNKVSGKVTITNNGKVLVKGTDYTVTYKNNKAIGKATATIRGIGKYSGTKTITFKIVPKKTSITKVTVGEKRFKVTWKAVPAAQKITKYQVRYKMKGAKRWSSAKTVSAKTKSLTVKKLKKGKTYQVQVRSYKTVKGAKYYSAWSKTKTSGKIK